MVRIPYLDQYLLDIKHMNPEKHKEFTGRSNELMLENAKKIADSHMTELSIRVPVIPGFNDTEIEIRDIAADTGLNMEESLRLCCMVRIPYFPSQL